MNFVCDVISAIKEIADENYCVYRCIKKLFKKDKNKVFEPRDIVTANRDGKCDCQEAGFRCSYFGQEENCTCGIEKVELAFKGLQAQDIIEVSDKSWELYGRKGRLS